MKLQILAAVALSAVAASALADGHFDRTYSVSAQPDLYVSTSSGSIRIFPGSPGQIHVVGRVHPGWSLFGNDDERIQRIDANPPIVQSGNSIRIGQPSDRGLFNNISIDYDITVPAAVALNLRSASGDIEVDHVGRYLSASSASGSVRAHGLNGPADLRSASGDIELQEQAAANVSAKSASGSIRIQGLNGSLKARTASGDIEAEGRLVGSGNLASASGSVRLHLASDSRFDIEAASASGAIRVNFPGAPQQSGRSHRLSGPVNGGGPPLEIRTASGDIEVTPH